MTRLPAVGINKDNSRRLTKKELTFVTDLHVFLNYTPRILTGCVKSVIPSLKKLWGFHRVR